MSKNKIIKVLKILFFVISIIEIYFEYYKNDVGIWLFKPLIMPVLIVLYCLSSSGKSLLYVLALLLNWAANIFFISYDERIVFFGSILFLCYRFLILFKIFKEIKDIKIVPAVLGGIPFLFLFLSLINMVYSDIYGLVFFNTLMQSLLMTILGGFALSNFVLKNDETSKLLLMSSLFFAINLFVLGVKYYFLDMLFLKPLSMLFFILAQYILYLFIIKIENNKEEVVNAYF